MITDPLPFEEDIHELELAVAKVEANTEDPDELKRLRRELQSLKKTRYLNLSAWETVLVARHKNRPQFLDYLDLCFDDFYELHGDRTFGDDQAIRTGFARVGEFKIMLIGHHKGRTLSERQRCFYGCAHPEGYRKALSKMQLAAKYRIPIVCLIDTPGAYPGIGAEERGQSQLIATSILEMNKLQTPVISVVIGEGGSGGALGLGVADRVGMLQFAYYSVISPEGCAGILWKQADEKSKPIAAEALQMTANKLHQLGVIDDVLNEPLGGAHRSPREMAQGLKAYLCKSIQELAATHIETVQANRYKKYRNLGQFDVV
jgi:acetyl-CoA carboxylase carboxyl transferase subunit alpha